MESEAVMPDGAARSFAFPLRFRLPARIPTAKPSQRENMKLKSWISTFLSVLCLAAAAFAQDLPKAKPEAEGFSAERLERIGTAVQHGIDEKRIAGAVTVVMRHGNVVWFKGQGMMDREASKAMPTDALFRICSMTKPITSVAVMMCYEEGQFLLDDPVSKYLPEFKDPKVLVKPASGEPYTIPATREITIRDLLRHTSGLTGARQESDGSCGPAF
jgi:CubicO group peptidase (beta-lactamase class C family)